MIELKELWGEIKNEQEAGLLSELEISNAIRKEPLSILKEVRHKLIQKLWFAGLMVPILVATIPFVDNMVIQVFLSILFTTHLIGSVLLYKELTEIKPDLPRDLNILKILKSQELRITRILNTEEVVAVIIYPFTCTTGFFIGMYLYSSDTQLLNEPLDWFLLLVPMVIFVPLFYRMSSWWNRRAYGEYLDQLRYNISELEAES